MTWEYAIFYLSKRGLYKVLKLGMSGFEGSPQGRFVVSSFTELGLVNGQGAGPKAYGNEANGLYWFITGIRLNVLMAHVSSLAFIQKNPHDNAFYLGQLRIWAQGFRVSNFEGFVRVYPKP